MLRIALLFGALMTCSSSHSQCFQVRSVCDFEVRVWDFERMLSLPINYCDTVSTKWSFNEYFDISPKFICEGGNEVVVSSPIRLQLNRRINNNVFAFAGVSVAPSYINFHQSFMNADINKSSSINSFFMRTNNFCLYPKAEVGLSYINDDRTFQISGSIGIERSTYRLPVYINNTSNSTANPK